MTGTPPATGFHALVLGHSIRHQVPAIHDDPRAFASMFSVRDLIDRPWVHAKVRRSGLEAVCPGHRTVILDSGGYQFLKTGKLLLTVDEVSDLYAAAKPAFGVALDRPIAPGIEPGVAETLACQNVSDYATMIRRPGGDRIVPVVHGYEEGLIERQCRGLARINPHPVIVGIGGSVPLFMAVARGSNEGEALERKRSLRRSFRQRLALVRSHFPLSRIHVFGAGGFSSIAMSLEAGADTIDSAGWRLRAAYGCVTGRRGVQVRLKSLQARGMPLAAVLGDDLATCGCPSCREAPDVQGRAARLSGSFTQRALHNFWVIAGEVDAMTAPGTRFACDTVGDAKFEEFGDRPYAVDCWAA